MGSTGSAGGAGTRTRLLGLVGVVLLVMLGTWWALESGMRVGQRDGPTYLSASESLSSGDGYRTSFGDPAEPPDWDTLGSEVASFPPGYPLLLSISVGLGVAPLEAAITTNLILMVLLAGLLYWYATSIGLGIGGAFVVSLIGAAMALRWAVIPQADVAYLVLLVGSLIAAVRYLSAGATTALALSAVLAAAGITVRLVGLGLVAAVAVLPLMAERRWPRRMLLAGGVVLLGIVAWLATSGQPRGYRWHPPDVGFFEILGNTFSQWFLPPVGPTAPRLLLVVGGLGGVLYWIYRSERAMGRPLRGDSLIWVPATLSAVAHLAVIVGARALRSLQIAPNARLMLPVAISVLMAVAAWLVASRSVTKVRLAVGVVAGLALASAVSVSVDDVLDVYAGESGFRAAEFSDSPVVAAVGGEKPGTVVSNIPDGLYVAGVGGVRPVPAHTDLDHGFDRSEFVEEMADLARRIDAGEVTVFYYRQADRGYMASEAALEQLAPCVLAEEGGSVWLGGVGHPNCEERCPGVAPGHPDARDL